MTTVTGTGLTGEGFLALTTPNNGVGVVQIQWQVTSIVNPKVRQLGSAYPKALRYAGVVGIGFFQNSYLINGATAAVIWEQVIRYECEIKDWTNPYETFSVDAFFYRLASGVTLDVEASY